MGRVDLPGAEGRAQVTAYYNEIDPYAAQWLRNLIAAGHIAPGDVDERSIVDVHADDLKGYTQCHFFAGIGGWSYALRVAGWDDDRAVWTGSCPCQPLSSIGQRKGHLDERHLWPSFHRLIAKRRPSIIFGEQVASQDGREWFSGIRADLEDVGYACGAADLCAASVGAPHKRQRLYWLAHSHSSHQNEWAPGREQQVHDEDGRDFTLFGALLHWRLFEAVNGLHWRRRIEPGAQPLVNGVPYRLDKIRGYGNAIVPQVAAEVIGAYMEIAA